MHFSFAFKNANLNSISKWILDFSFIFEVTISCELNLIGTTEDMGVENEVLLKRETRSVVEIKRLIPIYRLV